MNKTIAERARCIKLNAGLPKMFWAEAMSMTVFVINRSPSIALNGNLAEEVWTDNEVDYSVFRIFGCPAYVHVPGNERSKLDAKSKQCIFIGYEKGVKRYKFWDPEAKKVVINRDVVFDEDSMVKTHQGVQKSESGESSKQWGIQIELGDSNKGGDTDIGGNTCGSQPKEQLDQQ